MAALSIITAEEPDETFVIDKSLVRDSDTHCELMISPLGETYKISKSQNRVVITQKKIEVYKYNYFCHFTQRIIKPYLLQIGYALNQHIVLHKQHHQYDLNPVHYIDFCYLPQREMDVYLIFNIDDARIGYTYALHKLQTYLPKELVDHVASFMGCTRRKPKYGLADFPFNFIQNYQGVMPKHLSLAQIKKLYDLGAIKMAVTDFNHHQNMCILSDEAFDYVYSNGFNRVRQMFDTKENMHGFIQYVYTKYINRV